MCLFLIVELPILVLSEENTSDCRKSVDLEQSQTLLEGVVDLDLALAADNDHTTSTE